MLITQTGYHARMRQIVLEPDTQDGGWVVHVPSLPGCISQGDTKQEAIDNIRDAIDAWIEAAQTQGWPVPEDTLEIQVCFI